jgi:hypothetical protein
LDASLKARRSAVTAKPGSTNSGKAHPTFEKKVRRYLLAKRKYCVGCEIAFLVTQQIPLGIFAAAIDR